MPALVALPFRYKDAPQPEDRVRYALVDPAGTRTLRLDEAAAGVRLGLERLALALEGTSAGWADLDVLALPDLRVLVVRRAPADDGLPEGVRNILGAALAGAREGPGLLDETGTYLLYATGEIVVRLRQRDPAGDPGWLLGAGRWVVHRRKLGYAEEALVLRPREQEPVEELFEHAWQLQLRDDVACAYPVLVRRAAAQPVAKPALPQKPLGWQDLAGRAWHLGGGTHTRALDDPGGCVVAAWKHSTGERVVVGLVESGGTWSAHPDLGLRLVAAVDVGTDPEGVPQAALPANSHGTAMAGFVAARRDGPAPGVAPSARVLAVRRGMGAGALAEADGIHYAATHGASVVACCWAPRLQSGVAVPVPPHTRWAVDWCLRHGGPSSSGASVLFSAANQGMGPTRQSLDLNGYASLPGVMVVGASNARSRRAGYSCEGDSLACVFPAGGDGDDSHLPALGSPSPQQPPPAEPTEPPYQLAPGQTSSACACTAGVVALLLSVAPGLLPAEVREILLGTCVKIDPLLGGWLDGHSRQLGAGRVHAEAALLELQRRLA